MGSFWKLPWDQRLGTVLHRPFEPAGKTGKWPSEVDFTGYPTNQALENLTPKSRYDFEGAAVREISRERLLWLVGLLRFS